jgi:hypothetical protein
MTDNELDEMLDCWQTPPLRESLTDEVRAGFAQIPKRTKRAPRWRALPKIRVGRLATAMAAAAILLFALVQVSPRTVRMASPGFHIPFYVESIFERFAQDGSVEYRSRMTAFPYGGIGINMSVVQESGNPILNAFQEIAGSIRNQFVLAVPSLVLPKHPPMAEPAWFAGFVKSGCSEGRTVVGHETIAGYPTTILQSETPRGRLRVWMAPDLSCYSLEVTDEVEEADGSYRLRLRTHAVKVTINP